MTFAYTIQRCHYAFFRQAVVLSVIVLAWAAINLPSYAGDWPMYKHDTSRSSVTSETLRYPLHPAWIYKSTQPAQPAWPNPPRLFPKQDFDYAFHPVIAGGIVCFASNADDTIRALDVNTGAVKWQYTTNGPVRFAPQIADGKVYAASDDGYVYCLDTATGTPIWTFRAAPEDEQYIGNGRMISRWPIRTGLLVRDGVLYCVAGMWPSEGIYVYALSADTGKVIWCNDTSGYAEKGMGIGWRPNDPHSGEFSMAGPTPQGALLASRGTVIVPLGNNSPAAFSMKTGAMVRFIGRGGGSSWATVDGDFLYTYQIFRTGLQLFGAPVFDPVTRKPAITIPVDQIPQFSPLPGRLPFEKHDTGKVSVVVHDGKVFARKAFGLALVLNENGNTLILGGNGYVSAVDAATEKELWRAPVTGDAREIAVADGRVYVSTSTGEVTCFVPDNIAVTVHDPATLFRKTPPPPSPVITEIKTAGMDRGFALVVGDADGRLSESIVAHTALQVVNVQADEAKVRALRARLLTETPWYGTRLHVLPVKRLDHLPFAQYLFNTVVLAGDDARLSGKELYRVLRPYGGILLFPGLPQARVDTLIKGTSALAGEARKTAIVRGLLPGARDWNANTSGDKLVKWPLRPIWFGGPDPLLVMNVGIGSHPPVAANGRYFVTGNDCLTAVDAYNGTVLWTRPIPTAVPAQRKLGDLYYAIANGIKSDNTAQWTNIKHWLDADGDYVYLRLGENYFRGKSEACIKVNARTGEQVQIAGLYHAGPAVSLATPQNWPLEIDAEHSGNVALQQDDTGLLIRLTTKDPIADKADAWDLFLDFRPAATRYGLYTRGACQLVVFPARDGNTPAYWVPGTGEQHPKVTLTGTRDATGTTTTARLAWSEIEKLAGGRPDSFGFAVTLNSHDGGEREPLAQCHLFGDAIAPSLNNGWATIVLRGAAEASVPPAVIAGPFSPLPKGWRLAEEIVLDYVGDPGKLDDDILQGSRQHPLTGEPEMKIFRSGTGGCGNPVYSASTLIGRTNKLSLGFYDFAEDGGLHFFPGISPNCGARMKAINMTAALGMLIFSESRSHCECMIPIRTSLGFAPAERRLNEDWTIYSDRNADAPIRQAAINLGAFGDRRDDDGTLWLAYPRASGGRVYPLVPGTRTYRFEEPPMNNTIQLPFTLELEKGFGTYRVNADRVNIAGTASPWIYASGYRGIRKATLNLLPTPPLISKSVTEALSIDGKATEPAWRGDAQTTLSFTAAEVRLRHDADNLYLAVRRPVVIDRLSKNVPWAAKMTGEDAAVWDDDAFELFFSDAAGKHVVHLGISASGARYDALAADGDMERAQWNGAWKSAVTADDSGFVAEMAIPWKTLTDAGITKDTLAINLLVNQQDNSKDLPSFPGYARRENPTHRGVRESLLSLGESDHVRCSNFVPVGLDAVPPVRPRRITVRLHFAELDDNAPGIRVFDVKLQGNLVLKDFDIAKSAGVRIAVVREFTGIETSDQLVVELIPKAKTLTSQNVPILSGIEVYDETFLDRLRKR